MCDTGTQHTYGDIHKLIRRSTAILRWNETLASPYFDHKIDSTVHQVTKSVFPFLKEAFLVLLCYVSTIIISNYFDNIQFTLAYPNTLGPTLLIILYMLVYQIFGYAKSWSHLYYTAIFCSPLSVLYSL